MIWSASGKELSKVAYREHKVRIRLITVGSKMPRWVDEAWHEYSKRMPAEFQLELIEIPLATRGKNAAVQRILRNEGELM